MYDDPMSTPTRRKTQKIDRRERRHMVLAARTKIIQAANGFKALFANKIPHPYVDDAEGESVSLGYQSTLFAGRHINQAVKIVRHHGLLDGQVLDDAGFNR